MLQWSSSAYFKDKPACILHSVCSTLAKFSWSMCGRKLCWSRKLVALLKAMHSFFSASTIVDDYAAIYCGQMDSELVVKRVNDTRWCARADATMALSKGYSSL
ncbi:hypothetical protein TNCT_488311 [Trichonephila clavata]|uniref:Uncharacterized protein n=1 Tax=Trichonephila clavata TaxID=2740835 RepID=A0A8X6GQ66_TRICU|nr:hypothetical protein TNCT_488311 [Trichonephila clavata]